MFTRFSSLHPVPPGKRLGPIGPTSFTTMWHLIHMPGFVPSLGEPCRALPVLPCSRRVVVPKRPMPILGHFESLMRLGPLIFGTAVACVVGVECRAAIFGIQLTRGSPIHTPAVCMWRCICVGSLIPRALVFDSVCPSHQPGMCTRTILVAGVVYFG